MARTTRGYSRAFRPHGDTGRRYLLGNIPAGLWSAAIARGKRDGLSMRALILSLLTAYVDGTITLPAPTAADEAKAS